MFHTPQLLAYTKDQNMAPKISVLFLMVLALGISSLASPDNGISNLWIYYIVKTVRYQWKEQNEAI